MLTRFSPEEMRVQAYDLASAELVGEPLKWVRRGCTGTRASTHLVTTRYYGTSAGIDLDSREAMRFLGIRPGCSVNNNLYPANGVLNMPNLTAGCTCNYAPSRWLACQLELSNGAVQNDSSPVTREQTFDLKGGLAMRTAEGFSARWARCQSWAWLRNRLRTAWLRNKPNSNRTRLPYAGRTSRKGQTIARGLGGADEVDRRARCRPRKLDDAWE